MTNTSRIVDGVRVELVARLLQIGSAVLITTFLARYLGSQRYGDVSLVLSAVSIAVLVATLGIPQSGARYIAEFNEESTEKVVSVIKSTVILLTLTTCLVAVAFLVWRTQIGTLLSGPDLGPLLLIGVLLVIGRSFSELPRSLLQAFGDIRSASLLSAAGSATRLVIIVPLVLSFGTVGAISGYAVGSLVAAAIGIAILYWKFDRPISGVAGLDIDLTRRVAEYNFSLAATRGAKAVENHFDILMLGWFAGAGAVGAYTVAKQISAQIAVPAYSLGFTVSPMYNQAQSGTSGLDPAELYREALSKVLLLYVPAVVGLILVAPFVIQYIFGPSYDAAVPVLRILALLALFRAIGSVTGSGLDYIGRARTRAILKILAAVGNIGLNLVLIPEFGVVGAAIGTASTYGVYTIANVYIMQDELTFFNKKWAINACKITGSTVPLVVAVVTAVPVVDGLLSLLFVVCLGAVTWSATAYTLELLSREDIQILIDGLF